MGKNFLEIQDNGVKCTLAQKTFSIPQLRESISSSYNFPCPYSVKNFDANIFCRRDCLKECQIYFQLTSKLLDLIENYSLESKNQNQYSQNHTRLPGIEVSRETPDWGIV